jgi:hypothetical protein
MLLMRIRASAYPPCMQSFPLCRGNRPLRCLVCRRLPHVQTVNTELKEFQRERPDLWAPEALYYGGIVRRTVNPYHIIELKPWLQVRRVR